MNKTQLLKYMETPASLDETSLPQLDELIREFPFFQTARLLYVKNLKNIDSIRFENQLKIAAVYATSRKVLYELVNEQAQTISFTQNELPEPVLEIIEEEIEPEAEAENKTTEEQHFTEIGLETTVLQEEEIVVEEIILEETTNHPSVIATSDEANDKRPTTNDLTTNDQPQTTNKQNDQQQTTNQPNEQTTNDL
ncbi:MAG: hypothetical protein JXR58_10365, partial [Bacteroidales bacterium]|nr:hypothetical protein [Bacteroidales bacterium]